MPKTISDNKLKYAVGVITTTVEPRITKMVEELNKVFAKHGIRAGIEINWAFDEIDPPKEKEQDE